MDVDAVIHVAAILAEARRHGVLLIRTPDGRLTLDASSPPPGAFVDAVRRHRDALLKALVFGPFDPVAWRHAFRLAPAPRDPDAWKRDRFLSLRICARGGNG
jgi:hypothetical protein